MLVGRDRELALIDVAVDGARAGRGGLVLVSGEPGIGKTALATVATERARALGVETAWGRCREAAAAPPYWPWVQVVRALATRSTPALSEAARRDVAAMLAADPTPDGTVHRLFESVAGVLEAAASEGALLVVLDDLHRADPPSLDLLASIAAGVADLHVVLLGCYRDTELGGEDALMTLLGRVDATSTTGLALTPLDDGNIAGLVSAVAGTVLTDTDAAELARRSGGNPLFATEIARLMRGGGVTSGVIPPTVRSLIAQRVRRLPPATERALRAASVLGRSFGGLPLATVLDCSEVAAAGALQPAATVQLIAADPDGRYRFVHALIQETLYDELDTAERVALHRRAAEALAALPNRSDEVVADTAFHSHRASLGGPVAQALTATIEAARRAAARRAYEEAERWFALALDTALRAGDVTASLLLEAADAALHAGHHAVARSWYETAFDGASAEGDVGGLARAALGVGATVVTAGTVDWPLVARLEEATAMVGDDDAVRAQLAGRLAIELYWTERGDRARTISAQAVRVGELSGDGRAAAAALHARQFTLRGPSFLAERIDIGRRVVTHASMLGDPDLAFQGHAWLAADLLRTADLAAFLAQLDSLERIAEQSREPLHRWYVLLYQAELAAIRGEAPRSWSLAEEAGALGGRLGVPVAAAYRAGQLAVLARDLGRWEEIEGEVREAARRFPYFVTLRAILALLLAETTRAPEAAIELDRLAPNRFAEVPPDSLWVATIGLLAEVAALTGSPHLPVLRSLLTPHSGEVLVQGIPVSWNTADRALALAAAAAGDANAAAGHLERAMATQRSMGAIAWLARTHLDRSRILGVQGDVIGSRAAAAQAERMASAAGLTAIATPAAAILAPASSTLRGGALSRREREVISLLATGATNKEIAARLVVSINTVERHLLHIYTKLGVRGRGDAAAFAVRSGLADPSPEPSREDHGKP